MRNAANGIVQMHYGDDGLDPVAMEAKSRGGPLDFSHMLSAVVPFFPADQKDEDLDVESASAMTFKVCFLS